jgi:hypothetical protein
MVILIDANDFGFPADFLSAIETSHSEKDEQAGRESGEQRTLEDRLGEEREVGGHQR